MLECCMYNFLVGWGWTDTTSLGFVNWAPGEPNEAFHPGDVAEENCVEMYQDGRWNDNNCLQKRGFACRHRQCKDPFCIFFFYIWMEYRLISAASFLRLTLSLCETLFSDYTTDIDGPVFPTDDPGGICKCQIQFPCNFLYLLLFFPSVCSWLSNQCRCATNDMFEFWVALKIIKMKNMF